MQVKEPGRALAFAGPRIVAVTVLVMTAAFGLNFAAGVFLAPLSARYGWGVGVLSAAAAANTVVTGVLQPVVGRLADRVGPRAVLSASLTLLVCCYLLLAAVEHLWQFLLVYPLLGGAGFAGAATMVNSVLVSRWYVARRTTMMARTSIGINLGQLLLLPLAGWLIVRYGTSTAYLVMGLLVLLTALPAAALLLRDDPAQLGQLPDGVASGSSSPPRSPVSPGQDGPADGPAVLGHRLRLGTVTFALHALSLYFVVLHLPRYAQDLGGTVTLGGQALAVAAVASALTMAIAGWLTARLGRPRLLAALHLLRGAALLGAAVCSDPLQLFAVAVLFGVGSFPIIPLTVALVTDGRDPQTLGRLLGRVWLLHQTCAAAGVLIGGLTRSLTGSYVPYFLLAAGLMVLSGALVLRLEQPPSRPAGPLDLPPDWSTGPRRGTATTKRRSA